MKKIKSPQWYGCNLKNEYLNHLLLHCTYYDEIREKYLPQYFSQNCNISDILTNEDLIMQMILDPVSANQPETLKNNWVSVKTAYTLSVLLQHSQKKRKALQLSWQMKMILIIQCYKLKWSFFYFAYSWTNNDDMTCRNLPCRRYLPLAKEC